MPEPRQSWEEFLGESPITGKAVFESLRVLGPKFRPGDMVKVTVERKATKVVRSERRK